MFLKYTNAIFYCYPFIYINVNAFILRKYFIRQYPALCCLVLYCTLLLQLLYTDIQTNHKLIQAVTSRFKLYMKRKYYFKYLYLTRKVVLSSELKDLVGRLTYKSYCILHKYPYLLSSVTLKATCTISKNSFCIFFFLS